MSTDFGNPDFGAPPPAAPRPGKNNTLAVVALVCGILSMLFGLCCPLIGLPLSIAAIVCGGMAMSQIKRTGEGGRGMAIAGLATGALGVILTIANMALGVALNLDQFRQMQNPGANQPAEDAAPQEPASDLGAPESEAPEPEAGSTTGDGTADTP